MPSRTTVLSDFQIQYPWMPRELANVWVDAFIEYGDSSLAWQEVRNGEGRTIYDQTFPGNRREDGTLRLSEPNYLSTKAQYRNSLRQRNINPEVFETRFGELIAGEVSAQEFESRIAAVNENIAQRSEEIRRAFAEASGVTDFSPEATLATVLDPEGVGRELLERRISIAQVRGTAAEFGFDRSQERIEEVIRRSQINEQQARGFYSQLDPTLNRLQTAEAAALGERAIGVTDIESAALLDDQTQMRRIEQLLQRERAAFGPQSTIRATRQGAVMGLGSERD